LILNSLESEELRVGGLNVCSMRAIRQVKKASKENKANILKVLLQKHQLDILAVSETRLKDGYEWRVNINGYQFLNANRENVTTNKGGVECDKGGGGVAIYLREGIEIDPSETKMHAKYKPYECLLIKIVKPNTLYLLCVYIPPKATPCEKLTFLLKVLNFFRKKSSDIPFVIIGDFNLAANKEFNTEFRESFQVKQLIDFPTHIHGNTLDHIYIPDSLTYSDVSHDCDSASDHYLILCKLDLSQLSPLDISLLSPLDVSPLFIDCQPLKYKCHFEKKACKNSGNFESEADLQKLHLEENHTFCYQINDWLTYKPGSEKAIEHTNNHEECGQQRDSGINNSNPPNDEANAPNSSSSDSHLSANRSTTQLNSNNPSSSSLRSKSHNLDKSRNEAVPKKRCDTSHKPKSQSAGKSRNKTVGKQNTDSSQHCQVTKRRAI